MAAKVLLTRKDHFFYLSIYENSDNESDGDPKFLMPFPYSNNNEDEILETVRKHGGEMAENLGVSLEETLKNNA